MLVPWTGSAVLREARVLYISEVAWHATPADTVIVKIYSCQGNQQKCATPCPSPAAAFRTFQMTGWELADTTAEM